MTGEGDGASEVLLRFYFLVWVLGTGGVRFIIFQTVHIHPIYSFIYMCVCIYV